LKAGFITNNNKNSNRYEIITIAKKKTYINRIIITIIIIIMITMIAMIIMLNEYDTINHRANDMLLIQRII